MSPLEMIVKELQKEEVIKMEDKNYTLNDLEQKLINYIVSKIDDKEFFDDEDIAIIRVLFNYK